MSLVTLSAREFSSPIGPLTLVADRGHLREIRLRADGESGGHSQVIDEAARQLGEYFAGRRRRFDMALMPSGTAFQRAVWAALERIGYGMTATYGEVATSVGHPKAVRAVGQAVGSNPLPIVIPCHRVVAARGIGGYAGGVDAKRFLLELEGVSC